jgi:hypothetical protein
MTLRRWCLAGIVVPWAMATIGCRARPAPPHAPPAARPVVAAVTSEVKVVLQAQGRTLAQVARQGADWVLSGDGVDGLVCRAHDPAKRYCQTSGGTRVAEVKVHAGEAHDDGGAIKLLGADGKLRWKVRYTTEKIKLSDNEENRNPWTISLKHGDKLKVSNPAEQEVGVFRRGDAGHAGRVEGPGGEVLFSIEGAGDSALGGLLLVSALAPQDRLILMAELLARGL